MKFCWSPTSSIRTLIVSIIAAQIIVFAMLISCLAYYCGMNAVQDNSQQIFSIINSTFAAGNWEISLDVIGQGRHPVV